MCGIFGFVSTRELPVALVVDALRTLEYRGYDSWGIAYATSEPVGERLAVLKQAGRLPQALPPLPTSPIALGHTRWATHGGVTDENAHPHLDCSATLAIVHNGIIENYRPLREALEQAGHHFRSGTDSEIFAHLLEDSLQRARRVSESTFSEPPGLLVEAVRQAFAQIRGLNAFIVLHLPSRQLVAVKSTSPLVIGIGREGPLSRRTPWHSSATLNRSITCATTKSHCFPHKDLACSIGAPGNCVNRSGNRSRFDPRIHHWVGSHTT